MLKLLFLSTGSFSISALKMDLDPVLPFLWTTSLSAWTASWHVSVFKKHYSFLFFRNYVSGCGWIIEIV